MVSDFFLDMNLALVYDTTPYFKFIFSMFQNFQSELLGWTVFVGTSNGTLIKYHLKKRSHKGKVI